MYLQRNKEARSRIICAVEKQYWPVCVCVRVGGRVGVFMRVRACSLAYPACNAYAPYCDVICGLGLHRIFRHYLINSVILGEKLWNIKCVFWFSLQLLSKTFLLLKRIYRDIVINVKRLHAEYPLFLSDFNETWIFSTDLLKTPIKFHQNSSSGSRIVLWGQTDGRTDRHR
jgi:hypothetical protein